MIFGAGFEFQRLRESLPSAKKRRVVAMQPSLQALALDRLEAFADDEFGRAAADVHDQAAACPPCGGLRVGHAQVDQAGFLAAGDHFDARGRARFPPASGTSAGCLSAAHRVGGERAHALASGMLRRRWPKRARHSNARCGITSGSSPPFAIQALGQAHGFPCMRSTDAQLAQHVAGHDHVEAVRTQVDRRQQVTVLQVAARTVSVESIHPRNDRLSAESWRVATPCAE